MKNKLILMILLLGSILNLTNCSEDDDVKNMPPSAPSLKLPADKAAEQEPSIILDWGDSVDPEKDDVSYKLYFSESQDDIDDELIVANLKTSIYQLNDLQYSTNYYWKVVAKDENDLESTSTIFSFSTKVKPNTAPTSPTLTLPTDKATDVEIDLSLTWEQSTDADGDAISYDVYLSESENLSENELIASDLSELSYNPTSLEFSKIYYWKVIAKDDKQVEIASAVYSFTTKDKPNTAPTAPALTLPTDKATDVELDLSLKWEQSTDAEEDDITYDLYLGESENLSENELIASNLSELSYKPTGLEFSENYYWKVIAKDTKGLCSSSSVFSFTIAEIEMVIVQGGVFQMGSNDGESDEKPIHTVTLSSFEIGKFEVTQAQWEKVMGTNPSNWKGDMLPVEHVSWNDVQTFISKLNEQSGLKYRLPTEAEWEFAARGGNSSNGYTYAGSNIIGDVAWYSSNSGSKTHEVGGKQANELGIYDMSGNVEEWCNDWRGSYSSDAVTNPQGALSGTSRIYRGSYFIISADRCYVTNRNSSYPIGGGRNMGFRLARSL